MTGTVQFEFRVNVHDDMDVTVTATATIFVPPTRTHFGHALVVAAPPPCGLPIDARGACRRRAAGNFSLALSQT